ncbi:MAG: hypothetical protein E6R06_26395 [Mycobacterium sp.]|nr:MAG: hypothetical protein E6R06_26395 [Mycobacterium sp.]
MADIEKPSGTAATEVMGESWPEWSESSYAAKAKECLSMAAREQQNARTNTHSATYTDQEADGKAFNKLSEELHIKAHASTVNSEKWAALGGWATHMGEVIKSAKEKIVAEVEAHKATCCSGKSGVTTADMLKESGDVSKHRAAVAAALATMETELTAGETACASDVIPAPPGGVPKIPDDFDPGQLPAGMPATDPTAATGAAGGGAPTSGSAAPASAGAPLSKDVFAAPSGPTATSAPAAASPAATSPASMGTPAAAPAGEPAGGPMSGMPMGGGMPMSPPQMPQMPAGGAGGQTPGNDVAKTIGDTVSKLAGKDGGGTPMSADTLSKLLDAQKGDEHDGKPASGDPAKAPGDVDPLKKVFGNEPGNGATAQTHLLDPYSAANQNPSLNNPTPEHLKSPSPAAPVVSAAPPSATGLPMTQLSADENYAAPQQHSTATATATATDAVVTHPSAGGPPAAPASPPAPGAPNGGVSLSAYNGGALGTPPVGAMAPVPPSMGPMAPMPPMGGMMAPPAAGGSGGGAATPILAAAVPAAVVEAAVSGRRRAPETPARMSTLPPEHAAAEHHLAGLLRVFTQRGWATAVLAIACIEGQAGVRYVLATADALSLVPLGVPLPAGVELLAEQPKSPSFAADWSGHIHPGRKLAAWAAELPSVAGRLVYLVSNDPAGVPAVSGSVVEVRQSLAERTALGGGSPATLPRTSLAANMIPEDKASAALQAFGGAWGITDATVDDWRTAPGRVWAARWDRDRPEDYPAVLATFYYVEGLQALQEGRPADAAYSATALSTVRPYDWAAA